MSPTSTSRARKPVCRNLHLCAACLLLLAPPLLAQAADPVANIVHSLQAHNFAQAVQQSDAALEQSPNDPRLWALKGVALSSEGSAGTTAALAAFQHALELSPDLLPALEGAAQLEYQHGSEQARPLLVHLLRLQPQEPTANAMLAVLDYRAGSFASAAEHFSRARPVLDQQPESLTQYAASLARLDRPAEAVPLFARVLELQPGSTPARYNLALAQFRVQQTAAAAETLQPLLDASSPDEAALTLGADLAESRGDTQKALELLHRAILAHPKEPDAYLAFASLSFAHTSVQVGIDVLNSGLAELPRNPQLFLARGVLNAQLGHNDQAMSDFETANHLDPNVAFAGIAVGVAQSQQHQSAEALESFRKAARLHPGDALTQYLLAEALAGGNYAPGTPEAREETHAALRATELDPRLVAARDLLATMYLRDGETEHAIEQSQAALQVEPKDQEALYHLVLALRKSGQKQELPPVLKRLMEARSEDTGRQAPTYLVEAR